MRSTRARPRGEATASSADTCSEPHRVAVLALVATAKHAALAALARRLAAL
jgi:hypothetical protein